MKPARGTEFLRNAPAYREFEGDIAALAEVTGLKIPPNYMGRPLNEKNDVGASPGP